MMNLKNILLKKENFPYRVILIIISLSFVFSFTFFLICKDSVRRVFIFPSADGGKYVVEYRNLPHKPYEGVIFNYASELLLGSGVERTMALFSPGTKVKSCFLRKGVLYLDISEEALFMGNGVIDIEDGVKLLKLNIKKNFGNVNKINLFIDGKLAYDSH